MRKVNYTSVDDEDYNSDDEQKKTTQQKEPKENPLINDPSTWLPE
jgi:hypothetical protein